MSEKKEDTKAAEDVFHWPPLESDPEIFTNYLRSVGLSDEWQISEVFSLDAEMLAFVPQPCIGCIAALDMKEARKKGDGKPGKLEIQAEFFMKQTGSLDNACGVIAGIHAILNNSTAVPLKDDSILGTFKKDTESQTPAERATTLEAAVEFKKKHKNFAMQGQSNLATTQSDVNHHFVAFVINSKKELIELDGTKPGPAIIATDVDASELLGAVATEIKRRLNENLITDKLSLLALTAVPK